MPSRLEIRAHPLPLHLVLQKNYGSVCDRYRNQILLVHGFQRFAHKNEVIEIHQ